MTERPTISFPPKRATDCPLNPPPAYEKLRETRPVCPVTMANGQPAWLLTRYGDVKRMLGDPRSSSDRSKPGYPAYPLPAEELGKRWLSRLDPPEHDVLRRLVAPEFSVRRIRAMQPRLETVLEELLDEFTRKLQPADLVFEFALRFTSTVICELLGIPPGDHEMFYRTVALCMVADPAPDRVREALEANQAFVDFVERLIAAKQEDPGDDLISRLIVQQVRPGHLSCSELVDLTRFFIVAGYETTGNTMALGVLVLLRHRDQLDLLKAEPARWDRAVEEILRYTTITHSGRRRVAVADIELGGTAIPAGDGMVGAQDAANRDPAVFPDPDRFDIGREGPQHLAFGFGVHTCMGAPLARLELQIAFPALFRRMPDLQVAVPFDELPFKYDSQIYGLHELPVSW
jgi:cytochrome P450